MSETKKNVIIVGGHGKVALRLAAVISKTHNVTSIIRDASQSSDILETGAKPVILSLEDSPISNFTSAFRDADTDVVVFSAGAGGKGGGERTKKVDYEGALKVFDAIEALGKEKKPRILLVSAVDIRDPNKIPPQYVGRPVLHPDLFS